MQDGIACQFFFFFIDKYNFIENFFKKINKFDSYNGETRFESWMSLLEIPRSVNSTIILLTKSTSFEFIRAIKNFVQTKKNIQNFSFI